MIGTDRRNRLRRAITIAWRHRLDLLRALVLLPVVALRLRRRGYRSTREWIDSLDRPVPGASGPAGTADRPARPYPTPETIGDLAFVVRQAARLIPDATCLRRSLVLRHLLNRAGVISTIVLGVRPGPAGGAPGRRRRRRAGSEAPERPLHFHAWVEVDGAVVSEPPGSVSGYVTLDTGTDPTGGDTEARVEIAGIEGSEAAGGGSPTGQAIEGELP